MNITTSRKWLLFAKGATISENVILCHHNIEFGDARRGLFFKARNLAMQAISTLVTSFMTDSAVVISPIAVFTNREWLKSIPSPPRFPKSDCNFHCHIFQLKGQFLGEGETLTYYHMYF